jgi:hypothetical protein
MKDLLRLYEGSVKVLFRVRLDLLEGTLYHGSTEVLLRFS